MKSTVYFVLVAVATGVSGGITKEEAIPKVTVRLVRKDWQPTGYDPGTDEPLEGFKGNFDQLMDLVKTYKKNYQYVAEPLISATKLFSSPHYNATQPSIVITHPMAIGDSLIVAHIIGALALRNLHKHYNVFAMHSPWLSWQFQMSCARVALGLDPLFKPVAEAFASYLLDGISLGKLKPHQISFIGFSYSGTLNGYIAREIRDNTGQLTHTLVALDAFQYNNENRFFEHVTSKDAMYVHMFHSSSKFGGTKQRDGTVDIVINNGFSQPNCDTSFTLSGNLGCSHRRSVAVFLFAIVSNGNVVARKCDSWEDFSECKCNDKNSPLLVVSFPVNEEARGKYFLRTTGTLPYILGPEGAYCAAEAKKPHFFGK